MSIPSRADIAAMGEGLPELLAFGHVRMPAGSVSSMGVARVTDGAKAHLTASIPALRICVAPDLPSARALYGRLAGWQGVRAVLLPPRDDILVFRKGLVSRGTVRRAAALSAVVHGAANVLVTDAESLMQHCPRPEAVRAFSLDITAGGTLSPTDAADRLAAAGYARRDMISDEGEFALRGDILDIFVAGGAPHRINFFDETVENIKRIDPESMLSEEETDRLLVPPAGDVMFTAEDVAKVRSELLTRRANATCALLADGLHAGVCPPSYAWLAPFSEDNSATLFDYLDCASPSLVVFDEPKAVAEKLALAWKDFSGRLAPLREAGEILPEHSACLISPQDVKRRLTKQRKLFFTSLDAGCPLFEAGKVLTPRTRPVTKYYLSPGTLAQDMKTFLLNKAKVLICAGSRDRARALVDTLREAEVYAEYSEDGEGSAGILVTPLKVESGVVYPAEKLAVIGVSECVGKHKGEEIFRTKKQFIAPKAGDYVVHKVHGVGLCEGTAILNTGEFDKEYIVIRYRDGDTLYVAADQTDNLQKFVGEETPKLNKLGGKEFAREKEKVRRSVKKLAFDLLQLYAVREKQKGFVYSPDTVWQKEFEDGFEYEETADQTKAIAAVKQDMESGRIMDRVVVGDVGFGKTEVAFRAMFKTVLDGKQAVLLAPTTILARQHYENLTARLEPFGIKCGLLTRLQSSAENAATAAALADGSLTMVIATHKVLGKDIVFKDLGLLVLDEEQRFGVGHKEWLKQRYPSVNVLTLSATPIPRTLNMALSGVRDISLLETAPKGRLPVQTYVTPYSDALAADAILRECARGGQTLVLLNDIAALDIYAARLSSLLPAEVRIVTAHGQMTPHELERRISAFYEKEYDVLVATTIIENGIDLPDANTLIVIDSGRFGLSQLYQLRGRVGRRGALAHAYFTVPEHGALTETADKRLRVLLENTELGSGFRVALSDLSIRGAGDLLGAEQHGHIEKVGYEMYIELLHEAVEEMRTGRRPEERKEVEMRVDLPAYIGADYVSGGDKVRIYKRIAEVDSLAARKELIGELTEVYGAPAEPLRNLIDIALLKNLASAFDVGKVTLTRNGAGVSFRDASVFSDEAVMKAVSERQDKMVLTSTIPPALIFDVKGLGGREKLALMTDFFAALAGQTEGDADAAAG